MSRYGLMIPCRAMVLFAGATKAFARAASCDRACLRTMLDRYLTAVTRHDPAAAPLVVGFRETERPSTSAPGNGMWKRMTGHGKVQRRFEAKIRTVYTATFSPPPELPNWLSYDGNWPLPATIVPTPKE